MRRAVPALLCLAALSCVPPTFAAETPAQSIGELIDAQTMRTVRHDPELRTLLEQRLEEIHAQFTDGDLRSAGNMALRHELLSPQALLRDTDAATAPSQPGTARWPLLPVDRIYVRGLQARDPMLLSTRPWSHLSDHAPLVAEVFL